MVRGPVAAIVSEGAAVSYADRDGYTDRCVGLLIYS